MVVDEDGKTVDGDAIMYVAGKYLKEKGLLNKDTVVSTVMSNIGLHKALEKENIKLQVTQVGDKYVFDKMQCENYSLGGEQSGHIIFSKYANTGDGVMSALLLLKIMASKKKSIKELCEDLFIYPQVLINIRVENMKIIEDQELKDLIKNIEKRLADQGRILVRTSGTEPLIRVMLEAKTDELCQEYANEVVELIQKKINK